MKTIKTFAGMHVSEAARLLALRAPAKCMFNDIELTALDGASAEAIVAEYNRQCEDRAAAYRASTEGIAAAKRAADRTASAQTVHDDAIAKLAHLDFTDKGAVLAWVCRIQDATDTSGVKVEKEVILSAFAANGFERGANCRPDFDENDADNFHRYIVGQALDTLAVVAIHPMIHHFADQWRQKFA